MRVIRDSIVRPFRFMVGTRGIFGRRTLIEGANAAESVGYDAICIHDHLSERGPGVRPDPQAVRAIAVSSMLPQETPRRSRGGEESPQ
jgi:hypothetical protein